jgi:hypothetical protein
VQSAKAGSIDVSELGFMPDFVLVEYPLHSLDIALKAAQKDIPLMECGLQVIPGLFEAYRSSLGAPDHILCGAGCYTSYASPRHSSGPQISGNNDHERRER